MKNLRASCKAVRFFTFQQQPLIVLIESNAIQFKSYKIMWLFPLYLNREFFSREIFLIEQNTCLPL